MKEIILDSNISFSMVVFCKTTQKKTLHFAYVSAVSNPHLNASVWMPKQVREGSWRAARDAAFWEALAVT